MIEFFQQITNGIAIGGIYALVALGYTMVYGVLKLINFAHGELFTIGAYIGFTLLFSLGVSTFAEPIAIGLVMFTVFIIVAFLGVLLERTAYRPLRKANRLSAVVSALGASIFLQNAIMFIYGGNFYVYPETFFPSISLDIFGVHISFMRLIIISISFFLMVTLYFFVNKTSIGMAIKAVAIDQITARLMGINVNKIISLVFFIGAGLGAIAGVMVGMYYGQISFTMGWLYGLKAFTAAILGGIGNIPGAMLGGLLLGVIETLAASYLSIGWKDAVAFFILILILLVRPTGLLGERVADKL